VFFHFKSHKFSKFSKYTCLLWKRKEEMKKMKEKFTDEIFTIFVNFVWICLFVDRIYLCVVLNTVV